MYTGNARSDGLERNPLDRNFPVGSFTDLLFDPTHLRFSIR